MNSRAIVVSLLLGSALGPAAFAQQTDEQRNLEELRNTIVNLLQTLVQRGVLTREQAEAMVKSAQEKASADAAAAARQEKAEENAVRVPYVPEVVKEDIAKQVAAEVTPVVTEKVVSQAKTEGWGVPAALPDWIQRVTWGGDVRVRAEHDAYPAGNVQNTYLNFNAVNAAGGIIRAGPAAFLNTSVDRTYLLVRLRLDMNAQLSHGWNVGARLSTGTLTNPDSLNQVLGQYGGRYTTDIDLAYLSWSGEDRARRQRLTLWGGKFVNPFIYSDLIFMPDVTFEGIAADYRVRLVNDRPSTWNLTGGAIPVQNVPLTLDYGPGSNNKWLYAGQTALNLESERGHKVSFGVAYYYFKNIAGQRNEPNSTLLDYTAPPYVQKGNTMFDIRNTNDPTQNLFALAADYHELDFMLTGDFAVSPRYRLKVFADYVKNIGYHEADVAARVGSSVPARVKGYEGQVAFGSAQMNHYGAWDAFLGYRYIQRDAVVDAFTDQDYHLGGTDARGYIVGGDFNFTDRVWARVRYMPFDAIDGAPLTIDVWQVEVNARF
jgi:hypothetical protein